MGSDVKIPAKVDGEVEAYLMLLWFVFVKLSGECQRRNEGEVTVMFPTTQLSNFPQRTWLGGPDSGGVEGLRDHRTHTPKTSTLASINHLT
jgi:hypothetical protein